MSKMIDTLHYKSVPLNTGVMVFQASDCKTWVVWLTKLGLHGLSVIGKHTVGRFKSKAQAMECYEDCKQELKRMEQERIKDEHTSNT